MTISSAVVLAAGEGTRLRPLTRHRPKPMLPAANRPIIEYVLDALVDAGIDDLHVVVGYKRDRVQNHLGATYRDCDITYHHQSKQLGSGHALLQAAGGLDSDFLVVNGDQIVHQEMVSAVLDAHTVKDVATLAIVESDQASSYGAVRMDDDRVTEIVERPVEGTYRLLNAGVYAFAPSFFSEIEQTPRHHGELALTDTLVELIDEDRQRVRGVRVEGVWWDATYPWDLLSVARALLTRGLVSEPEVSDGVYVAPSASVHDDATLDAPVVVGPDCAVGPQAVVGPYTALGRNVTVNAGAVVDGSTVDADSRVEQNATVRDCVTGESVRLGAGAVVAGGVADVRVGTEVHEHCRLGGVVADRSHLGGGSTVAPGTLVGSNVTVEAGTVVARNVDDDVEVRN